VLVSFQDEWPSGKIRQVKKKKEKFGPVHFCPEDECSSSFQSFAELEEHLDSGNHNMAFDGHDKLKVMFSKRVCLAADKQGNSSSFLERNDLMYNSTYVLGWAQRHRVKNRPVHPEVKIFITNLFISGRDTGRKLTSIQMMTQIRKKFSASKYPQLQQVSNIISSLQVKNKKGLLTSWFIIYLH